MYNSCFSLAGLQVGDKRKNASKPEKERKTFLVFVFLMCFQNGLMMFLERAL